MRIDNNAFNEWSCEVANVMEDVLVERGAMEHDAFLCYMFDSTVGGGGCVPERYVIQELKRRGLMSPIYTGIVLERIYGVERAHPASFRVVVREFYGRIGPNRARIAWLRQGCPDMPYEEVVYD